jgi:predicted MFS family arabinose efflux permease
VTRFAPTVKVMTITAPAPIVASPPAVLSRPLVLRLVSIVGCSIGFYLPLAVVPLFAEAAGSRSSAGLSTGALLAATVLFELVTPRIVAHLGYRWTLALGLLLLGAPALLFLRSPSVSLIVAISAVRGVGFAIAVVAGGALTAALIPDQRRGEGLALVGLVSGVSSVLALPLGMWAAGRWGFGIVFVLTAAAPLAALVTLPALPRHDAPADRRHATMRGLRNRQLMRPAMIFATCTSAAGVLVTFLPLAVGRPASWVAPVALFVQPAVATAARCFAGRFGDRRGQSTLLVPGVILSIAGMAALAAVGSPATVVAGAAVFGAGFGILQNTTLTLMYARVPASGYSTVSAIWNAAYDLGMALGAIGVGLLVTVVGFGPAFLLTAATMVPALFLARREAAAPAQPAHSSAQEVDLSGAADDA